MIPDGYILVYFIPVSAFSTYFIRLNYDNTVTESEIYYIFLMKFLTMICLFAHKIM